MSQTPNPRPNWVALTDRNKGELDQPDHIFAVPHPAATADVHCEAARLLAFILLLNLTDLHHRCPISLNIA